MLDVLPIFCVKEAFRYRLLIYINHIINAKKQMFETCLKKTDYERILRCLVHSDVQI